LADHIANNGSAYLVKNLFSGSYEKADLPDSVGEALSVVVLKDNPYPDPDGTVDPFNVLVGLGVAVFGLAVVVLIGVATQSQLESDGQTGFLQKPW